MTSYSEIFDKEARGMTECLLGSKDKLCVGAWNVCTMYEALKTAQVTNEESHSLNVYIFSLLIIMATPL
jgi:hypothetical protein